MKLIPIDQIIIAANRQRREFDPATHMELVESIAKHGLLHPIVLRIEGEEYVLVSGERRLRAVSDMSDLGYSLRCDDTAVAAGQIPYTYLGELDPLAAEEAEYEENVRRNDYTWQERAAASARLLDIRTRISERDGTATPTTTSIAGEVREVGPNRGYPIEQTRREIIVAGHLDDPEVAAAKNTDEAFKILRRKETAAKNLALGIEVGKSFSSASHTALNEDAIQWLTNSPSERFSVICTDPPYGMGADDFGDSGGTTPGGHGYTDSQENFLKLMTVFCRESFRVTKPQAHAYVFCDFDNFHWLAAEMSASGWWVHRTPIIWHKPGASRIPWANPPCGPQRKYELILYAVKGKKLVNKIAPDLISMNPDSNLGHAAQKPVALFEDLLRRSVSPGDSVLDPFAGSGTIFPAAHNLLCRATGIELDPASYGICLKRLSALDAQQELPV